MRYKQIQHISRSANNKSIICRLRKPHLDFHIKSCSNAVLFLLKTITFMNVPFWNGYCVFLKTNSISLSKNGPVFQQLSWIKGWSKGNKGARSSLLCKLWVKSLGKVQHSWPSSPHQPSVFLDKERFFVKIVTLSHLLLPHNQSCSFICWSTLILKLEMICKQRPSRLSNNIVL